MLGDFSYLAYNFGHRNRMGRGLAEAAAPREDGADARFQSHWLRPLPVYSEHAQALAPWPGLWLGA